MLNLIATSDLSKKSDIKCTTRRVLGILGVEEGDTVYTVNKLGFVSFFTVCLGLQVNRNRH